MIPLNTKDFIKRINEKYAEVLEVQKEIADLYFWSIHLDPIEDTDFEIGKAEMKELREKQAKLLQEIGKHLVQILILKPEFLNDGDNA